MRVARFALVLLASAGIAGIAWFVRQREADARTRDERLQERLMALERSVPGRNEPSRNPLLAGLPERSAPALELETPEKAPVSDDAATQPRRARSTEEVALLYANDFEAEPVDPGWAPTAEGAMGREIDAKLPEASSLLSFECRSRFCRMEVVHDSIETSNEMLMNLFSLPKEGPFSRTDQGFRQSEPVTTPDGKQLFTVYIGRPGVPMTLPD